MTDEDASALLAVAELVTSRARPGEVFAAAAEQGAAMAAGEGGAVLRFLGDERAVVVGTWRAGGTRGMPVNAEIDFHPRHSAAGMARATRRPARLDSYEDKRGELPVVMRAIGLRASVAAPIMARDEVWGALIASTVRDEPLPAGTEERLAALAEIVGHAVERALDDVAAEESRLRLVEAADEERRRLERKLHEGYQQHILAMTVNLRAARSIAEAGSQIAQLLDTALEDADAANASLRGVSRALFPAVLRERGLAATLQAVAARSGVPVTLNELPRRRFAPVVEATVYFIVAEALANAAAHAAPSDVALAVSDRRDRLLVEVRDDGAGGADLEAGTGLRALADRTAALRGRFELVSPPGRGTIVRAEIPLAD